MNNSQASLAAGFCAGIAEVIVGYPFDTLKTRLQTCGSLERGSCFDLLAAWRCALALFKQEGVGGFYRGLIPLMLQEALGVSLLFGARDWMREHFGADIRRPGAFIIACCLIGLLEALVYCPLDHLKARMQVKANNDRLPMNGKPLRSPPPEPIIGKGRGGYGGETGSGARSYMDDSLDRGANEGPGGAFLELRACLWSVIRARGYSGLYLGFFLQALKEMVGNVALFGVYDTTMLLFSGSHSASQSWTAIWPAGSLAGVSYYLVSFPLDTIKSKLQTDSLVSPRYQGSVHCIRKVLFQECTFQDLYHGLSMCLLRAIPGGAAEFFVFELVFIMLYKGANPTKLPGLINLGVMQTEISDLLH